MTNSLLDRLHRLAAVWGPPGREHKVAEALQEMIKPHVDEVRTDPFGNLIAVRRGRPGARRVMLAAHMDTVGAIALNVSDKGLIHLGAVGDFKAHNAIGQRVVWGSGAVGVLQHEQVGDPKEIDIKKLWCDIGSSSREDALAHVRLGDMCTLVGELQQMGEAIVGPGLDNRAGCAVLVELAEHLTETDHEVIFAFTSQGEVGPRGAGTAAFGAAPDMAFVVDVAAAGDVPGRPRVDVKLGQGPALKLKDGNYIAHHGLSELVRHVANEHQVLLQTEIVAGPGGHTDAQVVSVAGQGVATAVLDIPARYRGTAGEMVSMRDLHATADLVIKLLRSDLSY
ncbi:MAG: endo,4-beta-glucanase [Firmicutes bacterium]|nr:endo,4-beta-glucanase [Bacillota bacterium]